MEFIQGILLSVSSLVMLYIALYCWRQRQIPGALSLCLLVIASVIWSVGSFIEIYVQTIPLKIFWRNFQQIGVFGLPILSLYFTVNYTLRTYLEKYIHILAAFSAASVLLIFTNDWHHLIRSSYSLVENALFGKNLTVELAPLGIILLGYNFTLPLVSVYLLLRYSKRVSPRIRSQVYLIIVSIVMTIFVGILKTTVLEEIGVFLHISVLYIPSALILFYTLFKYRFFRFAPIARDKIFEVIEQGILIMDKNGTIVDSNAFARGFMQKSAGFMNPLQGQRLCDIFRIDDCACEMLNLEKEFTREIQAGTAENPQFIVLRHYPLGGAGKEAVGSVLLIEDVTQHKLHERELEKKAETDALTGLLNRNGFKRAFSALMHHPEKKPRVFSVLMMDLDLFKLINDTYGHSAGDRVLTQFGALLKSTLRKGEIAARLGGEEFAIVLPNTAREQAFDIAEQIRMLVEFAPVALDDGRSIRYTVSIGITDSNCDESKELDQILHEADSALYDAKSKLRNCTVLYKEPRKNWA